MKPWIVWGLQGLLGGLWDAWSGLDYGLKVIGWVLLVGSCCWLSWRWALGQVPTLWRGNSPHGPSASPSATGPGA